MAIALNWPVLSNTKRPISIKFAQINDKPALTVKNGWTNASCLSREHCTGCGLYFYTPPKSAYKVGSTVGINLIFYSI